MHEPQVHHNYEEEHCFLTVDYDSEPNQVVIRGGRHGLAMLAELFVAYASYEDEDIAADEHEHWRLLKGGAKEFIINARPILKPLVER